MPALTARVRGRSIVARLTVREKALERRMLRNLGLVEERLLACVGEASAPLLADVAGHLVVAGGKRMRPLLTLLGAEFGDPGRAGVVEAAVVSELIHTASLHHDDVMDEASMRHGVISVNAGWGNTVAVRSGNWLLAKAAQLSADLTRQAIPLQAEASERLVRGQVLELTGPAVPEDRLAHYFGVISDKSASLIAFALRLGALQAGAPRGTDEALARYGEHLGVAFQIADDLLDITAPSWQLGKEQGKDLAVGVAGLPVLLVVDGTDPADAELRALLDRPDGIPDEARERALTLLQRSAALPRARAMMDERLAWARSALSELPPGAARRALDALCDFVASRSH
ncbi:polyprenyl synthetase family protein [Streptomyces sp. A012304]|uniref:polyprenyl synthetase family protein n=1 Tax=Streptomyces sp. A012304 TaxID=375446 RepID=UPI00222F5F11|nr:polyprenyl synthetase family protein [Streptomyces sp. A012304]GKQ35509.1 geranylgeranyl pyrophosphate synthase [Streptomyces sp. A012304]